MDFPFVGAGDASYFEWAEVHVRFTRVPTAAEQKRITADVPPPIGDVTWAGPLLHAASEQGVGRQIRAAYTGSKKSTPKSLVMQNRFAQAGASADARFNAHIEAWLRAAHAIVPILVAYRREDHEAGGTRHSDWHRESVPELPRILKELVAGARAEDGDLAARLVAAAKAAKVKIHPRLARSASSLERSAKEADEAAAEARWARAEAEHQAAIRALVAEARKTKRKPLTGPALEKALAALEKELPAFAKRLRKAEPKTLAAGASKQAIDAVEKALGQQLVPAHRALLSAFDGGVVKGVTIAGTSEGGARGRDELVALSHAYAANERQAWAVTVAIGSGAAGDVLLQARILGKRTNMFLQNGHGGRQLKSSKKLDALLDEMLKSAK